METSGSRADLEWIERKLRRIHAGMEQVPIAFYWKLLDKYNAAKRALEPAGREE